MGLFRKAEKIGASELSDRIEPIFITAFNICTEFGFEQEYNKYQYKDNSIYIRHFIIEKAQTIDAFSPGKSVTIDYKGRCVFDCTIKNNGDIKAKVFETGDWTRYFSSLEEARKTTLSARKLLSTLYEFGGNTLFAIGRDKKVPGANDNGQPFNIGRIRIAYDLYAQYWKLADDLLEVNFNRNEKTNVASSAVITYARETVFDAVHFFPSYQNPFSSNTKCKIYKKGTWEDHLSDVMNNVKAFSRT